jgi:hypothetical protein
MRSADAETSDRLVLFSAQPESWTRRARRSLRYRCSSNDRDEFPSPHSHTRGSKASDEPSCPVGFNRDFGRVVATRRNVALGQSDLRSSGVVASTAEAYEAHGGACSIYSPSPPAHFIGVVYAANERPPRLLQSSNSASHVPTGKKSYWSARSADARLIRTKIVRSTRSSSPPRCFWRATPAGAAATPSAPRLDIWCDNSPAARAAPAGPAAPPPSDFVAVSRLSAFLVKHVECRQANIDDFLFTQHELLSRYTVRRPFAG